MMATTMLMRAREMCTNGWDVVIGYAVHDAQSDQPSPTSNLWITITILATLATLAPLSPLSPHL